jgi:hypothetical protein
MTAGFQTQVNTVPAPAVAGDFATMNTNRFTFPAGPGGLVAGNSGVAVGLWGWTNDQGMDPDNAPTIVNNFAGITGTLAPQGFIAREQQGLNTIYLLDATQIVPQGFPVTLYTVGDFWVKNGGATAAYIGQKAYASLNSGITTFAAPGSASTASINGSIGAGTASFTGYVVGNVLNVLSVASGVLYVGELVYGSIGGSGVTAGSFISSQLSGTGGVGTYSLTVGEQLVGGTAGGSLSGSYGLLTVGTLSSGTVFVGGSIGGAGVTANTILAALVTGTGGVGTYVVNNTQTVAAAALTVGSNVETNFYAMSSGQPNELIKISRQLNTAT